MLHQLAGFRLTTMRRPAEAVQEGEPCEAWSGTSGNLSTASLELSGRLLHTSIGETFISVDGTKKHDGRRITRVNIEAGLENFVAHIVRGKIVPGIQRSLRTIGWANQNSRRSQLL